MKRILAVAAMVLVTISTAALHSDNDDERASLWGKYSNLVQKIKCPDVKISRTAFRLYGYKEHGYSRSRRWCGRKQGSAGYYVYVRPYWYCWKTLNKKNIDTQKIASVNGQYRDLIKKLRYPGGRGQYRSFTDYGYQPNELWSGGWVKPGFAVYVYPHWYIWKKFHYSGTVPEEAKSGAKYAYSDLMQVIKCPKDKSQYGDVYEYGTHDQNNVYCNQQRTAPGYWMYVYPNWYIWKTRKIKEVENTPKEFHYSGIVPDEAKSGKKHTYSGLLRVIKCPKDRGRYGSVHEYGFYSRLGKYCNQRNIPAGYWVYVAPNWYIWKNQNKK